MRLKFLVSNKVYSLRNRHLLALDLVTLPLAMVCAFAVRLNAGQLEPYLPLMAAGMLLSLVLKLLWFRLMGLYSHYWPLAGFNEALQIGFGVFSAELLLTGALVVVHPLVSGPALPRSIPFLDCFFTLLAFAGPRFGLRWFYQRRHASAPHAGLQRVLIAGAGAAGAMVARELLQNPSLGLYPIGFVDDDPNKQRLRIHGVEVLGRLEDIPQVVRAKAVRQVLIAIPSAPPEVIRHIVELCRIGQVEARILPGLSQIAAGRVEVQRFRKVELEDLLRREPIRTDITQVQALLRGKRVLVTGAGGSIGAELCRQIARCEPQALILLGHGENSIFHIHTELQRDFPRIPLYKVIADIRDRDRLAQVFARYAPEMVFHAAAHKHVPLMEENPEEAVTNNVSGTRNLLELAVQDGVTHLVMISTDKAVNPTSVMGATKRVAELLVQQAALQTGRCFVAVRFGNVLGSRGSVVPFFQEQIARGGPVTVTHPEITRFFMTIPEAVQLVLQAAALGKGGEIFVLDMGKPVRILDLARDLIRLAGLEEGRDIEIQFTGLRPGEKLYEELFLPGEIYHPTAHNKIFVCDGHPPAPESLEAHLAALLTAARKGESTLIPQLLQRLVPEYHPGRGEDA